MPLMSSTELGSPQRTEELVLLDLCITQGILDQKT